MHCIEVKMPFRGKKIPAPMHIIPIILLYGGLYEKNTQRNFSRYYDCGRLRVDDELRRHH